MSRVETTDNTSKQKYLLYDMTRCLIVESLKLKALA
jgi:hypothetical protein